MCEPISLTSTPFPERQHSVQLVPPRAGQGRAGLDLTQEGLGP